MKCFYLLSSSYPNNRTGFGSKGSSARSQDRVSGSSLPWKLVRLTCHFNIVVHSLSCVRFFAAPWTTSCHASVSLTISWSLLKLMSSELMMPNNHLILCCPLRLLPSVFPSIQVFSSDFTLRIRWSKYWSFSISPSNEYLGLFLLGLAGLISLQSRGLSRVFASTTVQNIRFFGALPSLWSNSHIHT